ncbi:MAG: TIGR04438 family Trp-rich protein [Vitreoscilla sp.]|nr:TIGR04438 family Trp-rich protein [Vitreoscilla sp.]
MVFVIVGVILVGLHLAGIGPMGQWNWELTGDLWKFVLPFVLALAWWAWADSSGLTKRREMQKDEDRKAERRQRNVENLGMGPKDRQGRPRR